MDECKPLPSLCDQQQTPKIKDARVTPKQTRSTPAALVGLHTRRLAARGGGGAWAGDTARCVLGRGTSGVLLRRRRGTRLLVDGVEGTSTYRRKTERRRWTVDGYVYHYPCPADAGLCSYPCPADHRMAKSVKKQSYFFVVAFIRLRTLVAHIAASMTGTPVLARVRVVSLSCRARSGRGGGGGRSLKGATARPRPVSNNSSNNDTTSTPSTDSTEAPSATIATTTTTTAAAAFKPRDRRPENVPGDLFVDHTCIDCDTCRWMAPGVFDAVRLPF